MAVAPPALSPRAPVEARPSRWLWTRERYDRAVNAGVFTPDDEVELLDGEIIEKMPQNNPHRTATLLAGQALRAVFGPDAFAQEEKPIALSDQSEPEPDVAVVRGTIRDHLADHPGPGAILLLVEVADSSLFRDRVWKARLYAAAGVPEYWIVNLPGRVLEIHRDPAGGAYRTKTTHEPGESVTPLARPETSIVVADLLP
jgi:Uma2 family endonuclease